MKLLKQSEIQTGDAYFATDVFRLYIWTGSSWQIFLSRNFGEMLNYEKYCVAKSEVDYNGANKILRLDAETGKGNIDITGSPAKIFDKEIDFQELRDGHAIVYNSEKDKWVNLPNDELKKKDLTFIGEAKKIVAVSEDGWIHGKFSGETDSIGDIKIDLENLGAYQVLAYNPSTKLWEPVDKDLFTEEDVTTTGEPNKLVRIGEDGYIRGKIFGSATEIGNIKVKTAGIKHGEILVYDARKDAFIPSEKDSIPKDYSTSSGEAGKIVVVNEDGKIYGKFSGETDSIGDKKIELENLEDGQILVYHSSTGEFKNQAPSFVGPGKSLILKDGEKVLGDYNGGETVEVDVAKVIEDSSNSYVNHLLRLIENLYLGLNFAKLDFGGCDALTTETFQGGLSDLDDTAAVVTQTIINDDSINVTSFDNLILGAYYILTDGNYTQNVRIKKMRIGDDKTLRVILTTKVTKPFQLGSTYLKRTSGIVSDGFISGDSVNFITKPILLNTKTSRAHVSVKHENISDADIQAKIAFIHEPKFVKDEVIGIGNGAEQTVTLKNKNKVCSYNLKVYFDGEETSDYVVNPDAAKVTFTAADGVIVTADYFYDWEYEYFYPMKKAGTYPDKNNPDRATTQFLYRVASDELKGTVAVLEFTLKQLSGGVSNEVLGIGEGKPQGFNLEHQAIANSIVVSPSTATFEYKEKINTVIVTAELGETIKISYNWKGKPFKVDSFAGIFNE